MLKNCVTALRYVVFLTAIVAAMASASRNSTLPSTSDVFFDRSRANRFLKPRIRRLRWKRTPAEDMLAGRRRFGAPYHIKLKWIRGGATFTVKELRQGNVFKNAWYSIPTNMGFWLGSENWYVNHCLRKVCSADDILENMIEESAGVGDETLTYYYRYSLCHHKINTLRNCPDVCHAKKNPCTKVKHASPRQCRSFPEPDMEKKKKWPKLWPNALKSYFGSLYYVDYDCACKEGYSWNRKEKQCKDVTDHCKQIGTGLNPCMNGGTCSVSKTEGVGFECHCMPAFTGPTCQEPRNPCRGEHVCGRFPCKRDPSQWKLGYTCLCNKKPGWELYSVEDPQCVDIDECHLRKPCLNGGTCVNTEGSYSCTCPEGWVGKNCEHRQIIEPTWGEWGTFGSCSTTCGPGALQTAYRQCNVPGQCLGLNLKSKKCPGTPDICENDEVFDDFVGQPPPPPPPFPGPFAGYPVPPPPGHPQPPPFPPAFPPGPPPPQGFQGGPLRPDSVLKPSMLSQEQTSPLGNQSTVSPSSAGGSICWKKMTISANIVIMLFLSITLV